MSLNRPIWKLFNKTPMQSNSLLLGCLYYSHSTVQSYIISFQLDSYLIAKSSGNTERPKYYLSLSQDRSHKYDPDNKEPLNV